MASQLDGPRLKVVRAREHLEALQDHESRFFLESDPYSITQDFDRKAGKRIYRIAVLKNPPLRRFAALIGDCVHNLRSALDHLVWQLSEDSSGAAERDTITQFPIFRYEGLYESSGLRQVARVGERAASVIRLLQPFHHDQPLLHPLWFVHDLDIRDKHRELAVSAATTSGYVQRIHHAKEDRGTFNLILSIEDIHDGAQIAELTISPPDAQVRVEAEFQFRAVLTAPSVPSTKQRLFAYSFLRFLSRKVEGAIDCFEPFYATGRYDDSVVLDDPIGPFHDAPPYEPLESGYTDEQHTEWAKLARESLDAHTVTALDEIESKGIAQDFDLEGMRSVLLRSNLAGFLLGVEMALERVREKREGDLELPPDK